MALNPREYAITFARSARKDLEQLQRQLALRILERIEALATNPRPRGCLKVRGSKNLWRLRIGEHRVIYSVDDDSRVVDIALVRHRSEVYRS